ncbi:MAG TPA: FTR1 family protein [Candidatus Binataceae bacterium]|nr:FTR1 family protein [Candidatus Binataceae bacterium]
MATSATVVPYFLYSSGILFREGLEALLVIIALVAGVRQAGQAARVRDIYAGALIAVAISLILAWAVQHVLRDNTSDALEGIFQLFASATLFYVSSWLTSRSQAKQWKSFISSQVEAATRSKGPSLALGLTAFLAVMREGAETIVFFQALMAGATETAERHAVAMGLLAGAVLLAIAFVALRKLTYMIPIGPVFTATSVLLYGLAVIFAGQGIASFQESGVMGATFVSHVPTLPMLGVYPTVQTLIAQGILLALALAAAFVPVARKAAIAKRGDTASARPEPHTT